MLVDLTSEAVDELGMPRAYVRSNERTIELLKGKKGEFESAVAERIGRTVGIDFGEPVNTIGGVIVESEDGKVRERSQGPYRQGSIRVRSDGSGDDNRNP